MNHHLKEFGTWNGFTPASFRRVLILTLVLFSIFCFSGCRDEREYPNRPIVLICPWSAGGGTDLVSRQVAALLEAELGVPVNVINATGGAGVTGHTRGALARPDGYTATMITVELNMLHWRGLTSVSHRDYRPSALLNRDAAALFVRADAPWTNLQSLTRHIQTNRGSLRASGTAHGGIWHLALAGWLDALGLRPNDVNWISINGAAPSLQELIAGGVEMACCSLPEARALMDSGRIRCVGVMAEERVEPFSSVPTFQEQGIQWSMGGWRGLALPARTPDPVFQKITAAITRVVQGGAFQQFMRNTGFNWSFEGPAEFQKSLEELDKKFGAILSDPAFQSISKRQIGPMFFPVLIGIVGVALLALSVRQYWLARGRATAGALAESPLLASIAPDGVPTRNPAIQWQRLVEVIAGIAFYVVAAEFAGFILTATLILGLWIWRLGRRWLPAFGIGVLVSAAIYLVFNVYLRVSLPQGWLESSMF